VWSNPLGYTSCAQAVDMNRHGLCNIRSLNLSKECDICKVSLLKLHLEHEQG